jgi:ABC-type glycerol-3-phosphate transport system permease component
MLSIPSELLDSARMDGCTELRIFIQIILPLSRPALAALAIFNFLHSWNNYLWPLIVLRDLERYTVPIGLATLLGEFTTTKIEYGMIMAGAFMSACPIIIFFLFAQRQFISGITLGAIKG